MQQPPLNEPLEKPGAVGPATLVDLTPRRLPQVPDDHQGYHGLRGQDAHSLQTRDPTHVVSGMPQHDYLGLPAVIHRAKADRRQPIGQQRDPGPDSGHVCLKGGGASTLLLAAGDNPERLANERSFASLCGVSPVQARSGKIHLHRLNRGGDRQANAAPWRIALVRLNCDQRTKDYARRVSDSNSKTEAMRCLTRYIAREVFAALPIPAATRQ